ncbi:hypothetical protein GLOTRDRAFT_96845 [Gloeophyllum trabeum ATCC 11539]|uniref:CHAT domain-containing protein n=1 Tax=Gloeophyllum trabeum (strain ATCC 11539 / FP-39264 / Madison 617) TaxID=670483 RepID=S7PT45_GLOTA|nr:uncharacterized protein GLOTRDRAFT_96845 [Gloeophyllum trabeum ATCC 11539]EPQ50568.1 hypothetical protein GLOTRDRAFT_96845 [Gloeophyllum trabeum ATCC 11539]
MINPSGRSSPSDRGESYERDAEEPPDIDNPGFDLLDRYALNGNPDDLELAISHLSSGLARVLPHDRNNLRLFQKDLALAYRMRFRRGGDVADIDKTLEYHQRALENTPEDHPDFARWVYHLGTARQLRHERTRDRDDLERVLACYQKAIRHAPPDYDNISEWYNSLGQAHFMRYDAVQDTEDLEAGLRCHQDAVERCPGDHPDHPLWLHFLAIACRRSYGARRNLRDIDMAIEYARCAREELLDDSLDLPLYEADTDLADAYMARYKESGDIKDLNSAVECYQKAFDEVPKDNDELPTIAENAGLAYAQVYERFGRAEDLANSLKILHVAMDNIPEDHMPHWHSCLGGVYASSYHKTGNIQDLQSSTNHHKEAVDNTPCDDPDYPSWKYNLAACSQLRFDRLGDLDDLDATFLHLKEGLDKANAKQPIFSKPQASLAQAYLAKYQRWGDPKDIEKALELNQQVITDSPLEGPELYSCVSMITAAYRHKYGREGDVQYLQLAAEHSKKVMDVIQQGDTNLARYQYDYGITLQYLYERTGILEDINIALQITQQAIANTSTDDPDMPLWVNGLGISYQHRYDRLGQLHDLEEAVACHKRAVELLPNNHVDLPAMENSLGIAYGERYDRLKNPEDLELAIFYKQKAVDRTPKEHSELCNFENNLGFAYQERYKHSHDLNDLDTAISYYQRALEHTPEGHRDSFAWHNSMATAYHNKYDHLGDQDLLDKAICHASLALEGVALHPPDCAQWEYDLASIYQSSYDSQMNVAHLDLALERFAKGSDSYQSTAFSRFRSAVEGAKLAHKVNRIPNAQEAYSKAFDLLPQVIWLGVNFSDRQHALSYASELALDAAACYVTAGAPERAVELLEQGRSILISQLLNLRTDLDMIEDIQPDLARELRAVSNQLQTHPTEDFDDQNEELADKPGQQPHRRNTSSMRMQLAERWEMLVASVRKRPGLEHFLGPQPFSSLKQCAKKGVAVILNCSQFRCDALIILPNATSVHVVPLESVSQQKVAKLRVNLGEWTGAFRSRDINSDSNRHIRRHAVNKTFGELLEELFSAVVQPVFNQLESLKIEREHRRIWWCPTGAFSSLPFHAAALHGEMKREAIPHYISSYIPTLHSLCKAQDDFQTSGARENSKILVVSVPDIAGKPELSLPYTRSEVTVIRNVTNGEFRVDLTGAEVSNQPLIDILPQCYWAHFACHGVQDDTDPLKSGLIMADGGRLQLSELLRLDLPKASFAFLSACQTALGDRKLTDEALHLAGGMLFAGFKSAIATLWSISDADGPRVARDVYDYCCDADGMPDPSKTAEGLHRAVVNLRNSGVAMSRWVPFIHMGM